MMKIKFKPSSTDFFNELNDKVQKSLSSEVIYKNKRLMKVKFFLYFTLYLMLYGLLFIDAVSNNFLLLNISYSIFGFSGILLAFNSSHDAVHNTLFKSERLNSIAHYLIFNLQGVNATLWKKRHISSHHIFPNVDGCDADIDNNPFIRLSKTHERKWNHKYQHLYAPFLYCAYTLHWILIKDFIYLSKKDVANMKNLSYSWLFKFEVVLLKAIYFSFILFIPCYFSNLPFYNWLIAFIIMHSIISIFFVLTLIISHLTTETCFPTPDSKGMLPTCYHEHQLSVSLDYHPTNKLANWIFGGFNSHAAHHLFPKLPHTLYTYITPIIKETAIKHSMPYNELSIIKAVKSHFKYLKELGNN
ncbi:fatty acid desaturase family protein [Aureibacter tunicatorum]|uniref:Linoleoyl-CoA desaturase n=1 Tax=Aureibacter tunicatorum TaxID=866807 RepID=A0AAE4BSM3_9BACT|nr:acyl-CoA desaturase [Aureibacter tunicatorum]MDR6238572.1 linoleoyl-CoA desaturase [Aureibacter tunicatorum]BDD05497.1 fatty acid desaturase [Aureibacter tunicatorum]